MWSRRLGTVCETSEKIGLLRGGWMMSMPSGNTIAGQVMCLEGHDAADPERAGPYRSFLLSMPAGVCGPSNCTAGPEQLG
jgi:hypothetical protein